MKLSNDERAQARRESIPFFILDETNLEVLKKHEYENLDFSSVIVDEIFYDCQQVYSRKINLD